jgi:hypothetical protein
VFKATGTVQGWMRGPCQHPPLTAMWQASAPRYYRTFDAVL